MALITVCGESNWEIFILSQVYLYSAFHNIDCITVAASQYQSKHNNNVRF